MVNYPYPTNFLANLPAWPVSAFCGYLNSPFPDDASLLKGLANSLFVYFNYTGAKQCIDYTGSAAHAFGEMAWSYQTCADLPMISCTTGVHDMFEPQTWNFTQYSDTCAGQWGVRPDETFVPREYGGPRFPTSRILFSNGELDPWSGGGVLRNQSNSVIALVIPGAAHHLDLRASNKNDNPSLKQARRFEINTIRLWLEDYAHLQY